MIVSASITDPRATQLVSSNFYGALAFLIWDVLITFDEEVHHIWRKSSSSWIKWLFLWTRYFVLSAEILNLVVTSQTTPFPLTPRFCKVSLSIQTLVADITMAVSVDVLLIIRVYALWNRKRWVGILLGTCLTFEVVVALVGWILSLRYEYAYGCDITSAPYSIFYPLTILAVFVTDAVILILTLVRCVRFRRFRNRRSPIVFLMARDGILAFFTVYGIGLVNMVIYVAFPASLRALAYGWFLSVVSSGVCRLILSMERLARSEETLAVDGSSEPQLTEEFPYFPGPSTNIEAIPMTPIVANPPES
ncbi:hypothetical protein JAAARDRAFT_611561 [Jaapia argillacea MUCL 33604]|uniref:DUF6533 domain-containing protein n=1 Tax=Jaapia argillacea MUCL 33604 TaxID=933084 RepID=A0A067P844_9AGAM|nr:hypothetical protein JAAARDRAFT_611561 [Jaapia argillacea MUCL 33604]